MYTDINGLADRYVLVDKLGRGGFGIVYKAKQLSTGQMVALKVMRPDRFLDEDVVEVMSARFVRELQIITQLHHPHIVKLLDSGHFSTHKLYTVLEFVDGLDLQDLLDRERKLPAREACHLMLQVLDALVCAHDIGVVHRDIKPRNIMVTSTGAQRNALVLDFGIAALLDQAKGEDYVSLTRTGEFPGTPAYIAPERVLNQALTPQSDIYAWGLVLLKCLTGRYPYDSRTSHELLLKHIAPDPVPISDEISDTRLRAILERSVAKDLDERYQSAREAFGDLQEWLSSTKVTPGEQADFVRIADHVPEQLAIARHPPQADRSRPGDIPLHSEVTVLERPLSRSEPVTDRGVPHRDELASPTLTTRPQLPSEAAPLEVGPALGSEAPEEGPIPPTLMDVTSPLASTHPTGPITNEQSQVRGRSVALVVSCTAAVVACVCVIVSLSREPSPPADSSPSTARADVGPDLPACDPGLARTEYTHGACCWPGQAHNGVACVGKPSSCPENTHILEQSCGCDGGQVLVQGHCCWPGQSWSSEETLCEGAPDCPKGHVVSGETCEPRSVDVEELERACDDLQYSACFSLGQKYSRGDGVPIDRQLAIRLLDVACLQGELVEACTELLILVDDPQKVVYLERACDLRDGTSCFVLGRAYFEGVPMTMNRPRAVQLFERACQVNHPRACYELGHIYVTGLVGSTSVGMGRERLDKACTLGVEQACVDLQGLPDEPNIDLPGGHKLDLTLTNPLEESGVTLDKPDDFRNLSMAGLWAVMGPRPDYSIYLLFFATDMSGQTLEDALRLADVKCVEAFGRHPEYSAEPRRYIHNGMPTIVEPGSIEFQGRQMSIWVFVFQTPTRKYLGGIMACNGQADSDTCTRLLEIIETVRPN